MTLHGRRADDLHGPAAPRRAPRLRPEQPADRALRRHPGAARADGGVRAPPRGGGHPGLGDDRDPAGRRGGARSRRAPATPSAGRTATWPGASARFYEIRTVDDDGKVLPWDGESTGEIEMRGPCVAGEYYLDPEATRREAPRRRLAAHRRRRLDRPGRLAADHRPRQGRDQVRRRVDLVGGPRVGADGSPGGPRGGGDRAARRALERAPAGLRRRSMARPRPEELELHLAERVAKWWLPDDFAFLDEIPKTSVGKFDKKLLRGAARARRARAAPGRAP